MTVEELYTQIDGNYADALGRLRMDALITRFVVKFLDDTSCADLVAAWKAGDDRAAFEAAHRAKGVCANMSFTRLAALADEICEALREGNESLRARTDVDKLVSELEVCHANTVESIQAFSSSR